MKPQRILLLKLIVVTLTLFAHDPSSSQVTVEQTISFSGIVDHIPKDGRFIVVNERRVYLSSDTTIVSQKGTRLNRGDLIRGLSVSVEGVDKPEGIYAGKITILSISKRKP